MRIPTAVLAVVLSAPVAALGTLADVTLIDRDTGQRLPVHHHQGQYWVAGKPGAHYAIHIQSRDGRRLLAVTSVDGVNVVTGETAGHQQRGYVFHPRQGYDIAGWRKSDSQIAAFTFTSIPRSYAAQTGRPGNVGVIGVALFRERLRPSPPVAIQAPPPAPPPAVRAEAQAQRLAEAVTAPVTGAEAGAQADTMADSAHAAASADRAAARRAPAPGLGTGHGRREHSAARQVAFERASQVPDEVIRIRYDSRANLVALGVLPRPVLPRPRVVDPFPDSRLGYVPDP